METQSPGSCAAVCSPPSGANWPKCLYLEASAKKMVSVTRRERKTGSTSYAGIKGFTCIQLNYSVSDIFCSLIQFSTNFPDIATSDST
jgi:hypothetical protein